MHPLRILLLISLSVAAGVAYAFTWALRTSGIKSLEAIVLGIVVFVAFLVPWAAVSLWAVRRASDLERLTERTHSVASGRDLPIHAGRAYHAEIDDLARSIDEMRALLIRQKESFEDQRSAMEQIVASLGEGLIAVNRRGRVVFANERVAGIVGGSSDLVGRTFVEVLRKNSVVAAFDRALAGGSSTDRILVNTGDGERQIEIRVFPVADSSEIAAVALFIDVTQIERLQRIRKDFLDDFSHEVRTPLTGLRSATETFDSPGLTPQEEEQLRHVMLRQLTRLERLINDLSELNRIESGDLVLDRQPTDLLEWVSDVAEDFRDRDPAPAIVVAGDRAIAQIDASRMQQVLSNLVDNAWKHGNAKDEILIEARIEGQQVVLRVSDRGAGIPPGEVDRIFNRFYRLDKSRSQQIPGLGLGLAIAKHLVLQSGGTIRAFNREGGGATFEVRLPC